MASTHWWRPLRRSALAATALALALSGCAGANPVSSGGGGSGFVAGSTGLTRVPVDQRKPAPTATGTGLEGEQLTTAHSGKVVVINVWGSWCAPCRKEAPDLVAAYQQTKDTAVFLGIDTRDPDPAPAQAFVRTFGIPYPSIYDPEGRTLLQFSGELPPSGIPSTLVIDPQGRVAARVIGTVDTTTLVGLVNDTAAGK
ncbi:thioredoxin [Enemella dayhoffiae]|uniref:Thioredoxin n=1 Tax=Enemella dayhoffiae TaxID=2016507 RepID=A0A255H564_9ACTN|nr:TlpA disulfide reductase family protein [Enemella dayhoffiae]OYO22805.1 thioredoxin [Enemella dayhoffiae]